MNRTTKRIGLVLLCFVFYCLESRADVSISIRSAGPDIDNLTVGQTAAFIVELAGLRDGQELDVLAATVLYDSGLLGEPTISPGGIDRVAQGSVAQGSRSAATLGCQILSPSGYFRRHRLSDSKLFGIFWAEQVV